MNVSKKGASSPYYFLFRGVFSAKRKSREKYLYKCMQSLIERFSESERLARELFTTNRLVVQKYNHLAYLSRSIDNIGRCESYFGHYHFLLTHLERQAFEDILFRAVTLYEHHADDAVYRCVLTATHASHQEGELAIKFKADEELLLSFCFSIVPGHVLGVTDDNAILISRIQGIRGKKERIRQASKALKDVHPKSSLFATLRGFARAMGIDVIAGVGASDQRSYDAGNLTEFRERYDEFFLSVGGAINHKGFFVVAAKGESKSILDVPQHHRRRARVKRQITQTVANAAFLETLKLIRASFPNQSRELSLETEAA